jgi:hypothetical protein
MRDLIVGRLRMLVQQLGRHHDEAGGAVAALERARLDERLLHRTEPIRGIEAFDGRHLGAVDEQGEIETAGHRAAVHQHGAAAAQTLAAGLARAGEPELRLQQLDQVVVRLDIRRDRHAVEGETDGTLRTHVMTLRGGAQPSRVWPLARTPD